MLSSEEKDLEERFSVGICCLTHSPQPEQATSEDNG